MIRRIDALAANSRNADQWRWSLWLEGSPIEIGKHLAAIIDAKIRPLPGIRDAGDLDSALLSIPMRRSSKRNFVPPKGTAIRILYDRVRKPETWHSLVSGLASIALGFDSCSRTETLEELKHGLDLPAYLTVSPIDTLQIDMASISTAALKHALLNMSADETEQAKLDMVKIDDWLSAIGETGEARVLLTFVRLLWSNLLVRAVCVAFFVIFRKSPEISAEIDEFFHGG
jgi:hypothetical protein